MASSDDVFELDSDGNMVKAAADDGKGEGAGDGSGEGAGDGSGAGNAAKEAGVGGGDVSREEIPKEIAAKVALLVQMFDEDKDNYLNQKEMSALSNKTSGQEGNYTDGMMGDTEWRMLCQILGADHTKGLFWTDLIMMYTKLADALGADLRRDFEICFPNQPLAKR
eukprot:g3433.t1